MRSQIPMLEWLKAAVETAGKVALDYFGKEIEIETKPDGSKVSAADYAVNDSLEKQLRALDPSSDWLSEESPENPRRIHSDRIWIIDPIDGTSSYLQGNRDWTIVAALIENGHPVLGAVYNPVRSEMFLSAKGQGAQLNGVPITTNTTSELKEAHIITSKSHFKRTFKEAESELPSFGWRCSMAYRIALVASGQVDATLSLTPKSDWDIAASHLILEEAGGKISTPNGTPITYNNRDLRHEGVAASNNNLYTSIIQRTKMSLEHQ